MSSRKRFEETYKEVEKMIYDIIHKFRRKYPYAGEYEDLLAEANYLFVVAYHSYDYTKAKFTTWVTFRIWKGLLEIYRSNLCKEKIRPSRVDCDLNTINSVSADFNLQEFLCTISDESREIITMIVDTPIDLKLMLHKKGKRKITPNRLRIAVRDLLKGLGWGEYDIHNAFQEIKAALKAR